MRLPDPAGFFRRLSGLLIDVVIFGLLLQPISVALFALSGGSVQSTPLVQFRSCEARSANELEPTDREMISAARLPADFRVDMVQVCRAGLFGFTTSRTITFVQSERSQWGAANVTSNTTVTGWIDASGTMVDAVDATDALLLMFVAYLIVTEHRFSRTFGKLAVRLRCVSLAGGRPTLRQAGTRNVLILLPVVGVTAFGWFSQTSETGEQITRLWVAMALVLAIVVAQLTDVLISRRRNRDPFFDRWSGIRVFKA